MPAKPPTLSSARRRRTAEEGSVPAVEAALDDTVEHFVFGRHAFEGLQILFDRIGIEEDMRRLDEEQTRILQEKSDRLLEECAERRVIGVKDRDKLAMRNGHAGIEIAGFGVIVPGPC